MSIMQGYEPIMSFGEEVAERTVTSNAAMRCGRCVSGAAGRSWSCAGTRHRRRPDCAAACRSGDPRRRRRISPAMVAQLRAKPGGDRIAVTVGDFADVPVPGAYRLIFVVWNTLFNLLTQEDQVRCFENVAAHLTDDGSFVVEAYVPAFLYRLRNDQYVDAEAIQVDEVRLDVLRHDMATQMIERATCPFPRRRAPEPGGPAVRMAQRARSHGADRRAALEGSLGRLEPRAFQLHQQHTHFCRWTLSRFSTERSKRMIVVRQVTEPELEGVLSLCVLPDPRRPMAACRWVFSPRLPTSDHHATGNRCLLGRAMDCCCGWPKAKAASSALSQFVPSQKENARHRAELQKLFVLSTLGGGKALNLRLTRFR